MNSNENVRTDRENATTYDKGADPAEFDRRARKLLGVEVQSAPVVAQVPECCATLPDGEDFGSWEVAEIHCGSSVLALEGNDALARLSRRLEHADAESPRTTAERLLGFRASALTGAARIHLDTGDVIDCKIESIHRTELGVNNRSWPESLRFLGIDGITLIEVIAA